MDKAKELKILTRFLNYIYPGCKITKEGVILPKKKGIREKDEKKRKSVKK